MSGESRAMVRQRAVVRLQRWLPALVWMALIFYSSSQSTLPIDGHPQSGDLHRIAHVVAYSVLAVLVRFAVAGSRSPARLAFAICVLYAVSDEIHQTFVPGRTGNLRDVGVDALSSAAALLALAWWQRRRAAGRAAGQRDP